MNQQAHIDRFNPRAGHYARHRPGYPQALYEHLGAQVGLAPGEPVADLGSGTGLLSRLFLENGHPVLGIEPNPAMRAAAEKDLSGFPQFHSLEGQAEAIPLEEASIGLLVAGQAFHWFDPSAFKAEAQRVLIPEGHVALIWNRRVDDDPFVMAYETLLGQYAIDYYKADPKHRMTEEKIAAFFAPVSVRSASFPNASRYNWQGLRGLAMSQSYVPLPDHPNHAGFLSGLRALFDQFQDDTHITLSLTTKLFFGPLRPR